jgi:hypothetical protein
VDGAPGLVVAPRGRLALALAIADSQRLAELELAVP